MLSRAQIEAVQDFQVVTVAVPGYGDVGLRSWDGFARDSYDTCLMRQSAPARDDRGQPVSRLTDLKRIKTVMLALSICNEQGQRLFNAADENDLKFLDSRGLVFIDTLIPKIRELNGLNVADAEAAEKKSASSTASTS